jgi:predicted TIM-barrel fold metal-dependent hydrolase
MMIIDNHAHIFPYLGGKSEYESVDVQLLYAQKLISDHFEPIRKVADYSAVEENNLWDNDKPGPSGKRNVSFRAGRFGRYEWTVDGNDYCKQYMPVSLQDMVASPEFLLAQMDFVGIDKAVLQRAHIYGKLEKYYQRAIKQFPDKFIGLAQIDESIAYEESQVEELVYDINELGLSGLYFEPGTLFKNEFKHNFDDEIYGPFWKEVAALSIPIYSQTDRSLFIEQMKSWLNVLEKHPQMVLVISLGIPEQVLMKENKVEIPNEVNRLMKDFKVYLEIAYPISIGKTSAYPFQMAQRLTKEIYDAFGPERLVWGSDIPNVERYCTYAQSLKFFTENCDFVSEKDRERILAQNVLDIFGLKS